MTQEHSTVSGANILAAGLVRECKSLNEHTADTYTLELLELKRNEKLRWRLVARGGGLSSVLPIEGKPADEQEQPRVGIPELVIQLFDDDTPVDGGPAGGTVVHMHIGAHGRFAFAPWLRPLEGCLAPMVGTLLSRIEARYLGMVWRERMGARGYAEVGEEMQAAPQQHRWSAGRLVPPSPQQREPSSPGGASDAAQHSTALAFISPQLHVEKPPTYYARGHMAWRVDVKEEKVTPSSETHFVGNHGRATSKDITPLAKKYSNHERGFWEA